MRQPSPPTMTNHSPTTPNLTPHTMLCYAAAAILLTSSTTGSATKITAATFQRRLVVLICYTHIVDTNHLYSIWFEFAMVAREKFRPTLEYECTVTARCLCLAPPVIKHGVSGMVRGVQFVTHDYTFLLVGASAFLFVVQQQQLRKLGIIMFAT